MSVYKYFKKYVKVGFIVGVVIYSSNMISICIPNNTYVDPKYVYNNMTADKVSDCVVISLTKAIIGGVTWPFLIINTLVKSNTLLAPLCLGHFRSPYFISNNFGGKILQIVA